MSFNIIRNDITKLQVDAIVNAANSRLQAGGGVCGAIFSAAGREELQAECDKIGYCAIGEAIITKGFKLSAKYIIHTVGPIYGENPRDEEEQLYSCYKNSLVMAKRKRLSSIAFPVISSGIYGYPKTEAIKIATGAIKDFLEENEMAVFLVVYDRDTFSISEKLFSSVESYIDERMVKTDNRRRICESVAFTECMGDIEYDSELLVKSADIIPENKPVSPQAPLMSDMTIGSGATVKSGKRSLQSLLDIKAETFSEMLLRLIDEKGMTDVEVYKRANIDRKLFSKIRKKDYIPRKITVIALAIGLKLNLDETKDLLARAGFAFSDWSKFDIIIEYFIENGNYDIYEINETLFAFDQQLLGA